MASGCSVAGFYRDASIFLTGATGFLGKCLIEKLLRDCPEIANIYVLVRSKKGSTPQERIQALFDSKLFEKLLKDQPDAREKVIAITGDVMDDNLGISAEDEASLIAANISVVVHSAATVKFNDPLRSALQMNVGGTQKVIALSKKLPNLRCLVHVSTAYANCDMPNIKEQVYPPASDPHKLLDALDWLTEEAAEKIQPVLLGKKPNTYTFTKQLAEDLLVKEAGSLPYIIVRPSIVGCTWKEPFAGWIDNYNGPSGLLVAVGSGFMRTYQCNPDVVADIIPVDVVVNALITAPWYRCLTNEPCVVNCTSDNDNQITWGRLTDISYKALVNKAAYNEPFRYPNCTYTSSPWMFGLYSFLCHKLPAVTIDAGLKCMGKKPKMGRVYNSIHKALETLEFFLQNSWKWERNNMMMIQKNLSPEDAKVFDMDTSRLDWGQYLEDFCVGTKVHLMKEDNGDMARTKQKHFKLKTIHYMMNFITTAAFFKMLMLRSEFATKLFNAFVLFCVRRVKALRLDSVITW
jgi:fatty acyl-CoA reductase